MIKLACMTLPYSKLPFERALEGISRAGYRYVAFGLPHAGIDVPDENDDQAIPTLQRLFFKYSLEPVMLIGNQQFKPGEPIERARKRLQTAKSLGIREVISVGAGSYRAFPTELLPIEEYQQKHRDFVQQYQKVAQEAEALDMIVTIKPHTGNTGTASLILDTLEQIGSPFVRASYDPGNVQFYEGISAKEDLRKIAEITYSIIAKDHRGAQANIDFPVPGTGDVDFRAIFHDMKNASFAGNIVVERVDGPADPDLIDQRMLESRLSLEQLLQETGLLID